MRYITVITHNGGSFQLSIYPDENSARVYKDSMEFMTGSYVSIFKELEKMSDYDYDNWESMLKALCEELGDDYSQIECTLDAEKMKVNFNRGFGGVEGEPFTAWSENYVFFPVCYDGAEWIGYAPRNPCGIVTMHQGGG